MTLRRIAGLAGLVTAVLFALTIILTFAAGAPPALDDPAPKVSQYYEDNRSMLQLSGILGFLSLFTIALWFIPIYRWIRDRSWAAGGTAPGTAAATTTARDTATAGGVAGATAEDDTVGWATIALAEFIATGAVAAVQTAVATAIASGIEDELGGNDATVTALFDFYNALGAAVGVLIALFTVGLAFAARGTDFVPTWASPVLLAVAVLSLLSMLGPFTESDFFAILSLLAFILFIVVLVGSSLRLMGGAGAGRGTTRTV